MKKCILIFTAFIAAIQLNAQYPVGIGTMTGIADNLPYNNQYNYNWCTVLYPKDRIQAHGNIVKISYELSSLIYETARDQKIYIGTTSDIEFTDAGYPNTALMTLVYDGFIDYERIQVAGVTEIVLDSPFAYDGTENLIIHLENHDGTKNTNTATGFSDEADNNYTTNMCKYNYHDDSFPTSAGMFSTQMPIVYLGFESGLDVGVSNLSNNNLLPGINDLSLNFRNYMGDTINTCEINWELNGVLQTPVNWVGTVYTGQVSEDVLILNDYDFAPGTYQIKAWTANPNAGTDELNTNDTLTTTISVSDYIEIADGFVNHSSNIPYYGQGYQGWSASIINKDSVNLNGKICGLAYNVLGGGILRDNQTLFLSHIADNYHQTTSMPDETSMTNTFSGTVDYTGTGWKNISFDNIFEYNNSDNILVYYKNRSNQSASTSFTASSYEGNTGLYKFGDEFQVFPTGDGTLTATLPNVRVYFLIPVDAGLTSMDAPATYFNVGNNNIEVSLKNFGTENLTSANINFQVDNGTIQTFNWTGNIACYDTLQNIIIGNEDLSYGDHTIKIWTDLPNGLNDYKNQNDTLSKTIYATDPLCGTYVIGDAPSDFPTINEAIDSLNSSGVTCDVVFDIKPGTYNNQYIINEIKDAGQNSTITFKSQTADSTDVILTTNSTDYLIKLNGADNLIFENLTFTSDNAEKLMVIDSGACNNVFENNQFVNGALQIFSTGTTIADTNNLISGNLFLNGNNAIYLDTDYTTYETNNSALSNVFKNQSGASIAISYQENSFISENSFETNEYALHCVRGKNCTITKNNIKTEWSAIYLHNLGSIETNLVANNFIICKSNVSGESIRLSTNNLKFYNNTIKSIGNQNLGGTIIQVFGNNNDFKNNLLVNLKSGPTINIGVGYSGNISDYNCMYSNGASIAEWQNTKCADLGEWNTASGLDANSISILPDFFSETDLHINTLAIDDKGTPLTEVTDDIDGEIRNASNPDIGADEFTSTCSGPLSGSYIIGASGDYTTINDALYALLNCGVSGSVTFNLESQTFNEQVIFPEYIPGKTEEDSLVFTSASGDAEDVIITFDASKNDNYVIKLDGLDNFVLQNITIEAQNSQYGRLIEIENHANHSVFDGNVFIGIETQENNDSLALIYYPEGSIDSSQVFINNTFINGSRAIVKNNAPVRSDSFTISNNHFINQGFGSVYLRQLEGFLFESNTVKTNTVSYQCIEATTGDSASVRKNIVDIDAHGGYFINTYFNNTVLENNYISFHSTGSEQVFLIYLIDNVFLYYNTLVIRGLNDNSQFCQMNGTCDQLVQLNNVMANLAQGKIYNNYWNIPTVISDHNNLFTNGKFFGQWGRVDYDLFENYVSATGHDVNSVSVNPAFLNDSTWYSQHILHSNTGTPVTGITTDMDGNIRDAATPDIGAEEFTDATYSLGEDVRLCANETYTIHAGIGFDSYLWSTGSDSATALIDTAGVGMGAQEITIQATVGGTEYFDTIVVTFSSPVATPVADYCFNAEQDSILISAGDGTIYSWSTGDTTQSIYISSDPWFYVTVTDEYGCSSQGRIGISYNSTCNADMGTEENITVGLYDDFTLNANQCDENNAMYDYIWSTGDSTYSITYSGEELGIGSHTIWVTVINKSRNYCASTDTIELSIPAPVPFHGNYIIGGTTPDYETINDAVNDLRNNGVDGPVVFTLENDIFTEQVIIPEILGASSTNTITFTSVAGEPRIISSPNDFTVKLDGADHITFDKVKIVSTNNNNPKTVIIESGASNNRFVNSIISQDAALVNAQLLYSGSSADSNNVFESNTFINGTNGIYLSGSDIEYEHNNQILGNNFLNISNYPVQVVWQDTLVISGNNIYNNSNSAINVSIENSLHGLIANNMINNQGISGNPKGIVISNSAYQKIYYNTIKNLDGTPMILDGQHLEVKNNILVNDPNYYYSAIQCDDSTGFISDYNVFYSYNMSWQGESLESLEAWQDLTGNDANSLWLMPQFVSDDDLHVNDLRINYRGIPVPEVTVDIDGEPRDVNHPDIGADEVDLGVPMAGEYHVGPSQTITSFNQAIDSVVSVGVIDSVVFLVDAGTYTEQVSIPYIVNSSAENTITFRSATGNAADVVLEYESSAADNYIVMFDSASYIIIEQMTLSALDSANAIVIRLENDSKNNIIRNNIINGLGESSSNILAQNGDNSENLFQGNIITGGLNGFMLLGKDGLQSTGNKIIGNTMVDQLQAGIYLKYQQQHQILGNEVSHIDPITKKWVGIGMVNCTSSYRNRGLTANNMVYYNANQLSTGLFLSASSYQNVYHNNVHIFGASNDSRAFNQEAGGSNNTVINNIFSNRANGVVIYSTNPGTYDYNVLYGDSERFIYTTEWINDLPTWQAQGKGTHSLTIDPLFVSDSDLHIQEVQLFGKGSPIADVTIDFDGDGRDLSNVTIGADVFSSSCIAPLSGIQTIGSGKDFETINDAVLALMSCGVDGDVTFEIVSGTYNEQVYIPGNFTGKTAEDAVTFRSASGNPNDVIISHDASKDNNYVIKIDGLDNFVLENLTLEAVNNTFGRVIEISNNANHSLFNGNIFKGVPANENNDSLALIYYAKGSIASAQVFTNNTFENGSKAIVKTDIAQKVDFFDVSNNSFMNQSSGVIEIEQVTEFSFDLNTITTTDITQFNALTLSCDTVTLSRNQIDIHAEAGNAINSNAKMTVLENNYISFTSHTEEEVSLIGIYDDIYIYFNTLVIRGDNTNSQINKAMRSYGIQLTQKNNIMSNLAGGKVYSMQYGIENSTSDHNNLFTNGTFGKFEDAQYGSFSDYVQTTGQDANSVSTNPVFMDDASWYSRHVLLNNTGTPVDGITTDLEGNARDATTPDIGAEEFADATYSMGGDVRLCADDSYTIHAGIGFDSYNWSTGSDSVTAWIDTTGVGMGAQEITLTATIGGTDFTDTIVITLSSPVATPITDYCFNEGVDSIRITAGDGVAWNWNSGDTTQSIYISTDNYPYVTVTDEHGCSSEGSIHVHFNSCPADLNTSGESVIPENESITLQANQCREDYFQFDYSWSTGDTTSQITLRGTDLGIGTHEVMVSIANAHANYCTSADTMLITVEKASGLNHNEASDIISIYPNPTKGVVYIKSQNAIILGVEIYNLQGNMLFKSNEINNSELNMTGYEPGIYLIQIETERQSIIKRLIIK